VAAGRDKQQQLNLSDQDNEQQPTEVVKKKKRKINIFPTNVPPTAFSFLPDVTGGGPDIPTILSPVKESDSNQQPPTRSTSSSVMGSIGAMLKSSFSSRR